LAQLPPKASKNRLRGPLTRVEGEKRELPKASIRLLLDAFSLKLVRGEAVKRWPPAASNKRQRLTGSSLQLAGDGNR
jgi:hypothetical protein